MKLYFSIFHIFQQFLCFIFQIFSFEDLQISSIAKSFKLFFWNSKLDGAELILVRCFKLAFVLFGVSLIIWFRVLDKCEGSFVDWHLIIILGNKIKGLNMLISRNWKSQNIFIWRFSFYFKMWVSIGILFWLSFIWKLWQNLSAKQSRKKRMIREI